MLVLDLDCATAQKKQKRFSWMQGKKLASESSEGFEGKTKDIINSCNSRLHFG